MPQQTYVVQYNNQLDIYLIAFTGQLETLEYEDCTWGSLENAIEFSTQSEVDEIAERINSGTVGLPKPKPNN